MGKWFNENMSYNELLMAFCSLTREEYEAHTDEIMKEYSEAYQIIMKRELELVEQGWIF